MARVSRHLGEDARNPQRRPVLVKTAGRRVPTEGNDAGSGAAIQGDHFNGDRPRTVLR
jgi:hypothetical protein